MSVTNMLLMDTTGLFISSMLSKNTTCLLDVVTTIHNDSGAVIESINQRIIHRLLPVTILTGTEAVLGLIGNILILNVYSRFYQQCNFRYFVLFLAFYDLTSCLTALPGEMYLQLNWFNFQRDSICKIKSYFNVFTAWGSAFTLFLLACDRYRKVCKPLKAPMPPSKALKLCVTGVILSFLVSIPDAVLWGKQSFTFHYMHPDGNYTLNLSICEKANEYKDEIYPFIYIVAVYILPIGVMALVICTVNILIAREMFCWSRKRNLSRTHRHSSVQTEDVSVLTVSKRVRTSVYSARNTRKNSRHENKDNDAAKGDLTVMCSTVSLELLSIRRLSSKRGRCEIKEGSDASNEGRERRQIDVIQPTAVRHCLRTVTQTSNDTDLRTMRKTLIMLILTSVFVLTITIYVGLITVVAKSSGQLDVMRQLENPQFVVFLFFLRLYYVNVVINLLLYGLLDSRFRTGLKRLLCSIRR